MGRRRNGREGRALSILPQQEAGRHTLSMQRLCSCSVHPDSSSGGLSACCWHVDTRRFSELRRDAASIWRPRALPVHEPSLRCWQAFHAPAGVTRRFSTYGGWATCRVRHRRPRLRPFGLGPPPALAHVGDRRRPAPQQARGRRVGVRIEGSMSYRYQNPVYTPVLVLPQGLNPEREGGVEHDGRKA